MTNSHRTDAEWDAAAQWAERELPDASPGRRVLRGQAAGDYGRSVLEAALGSPAAVEKAIGGRPKLNPDAPVGQHARQRRVRLPAALDTALDAAAAAQGRNASAVLRDALGEYLTAHHAS